MGKKVISKLNIFQTDKFDVDSIGETTKIIDTKKKMITWIDRQS